MFKLKVDRNQRLVLVGWYNNTEMHEKVHIARVLESQITGCIVVDCFLFFVSNRIFVSDGHVSKYYSENTLVIFIYLGLVEFTFFDTKVFRT